MTSPATRLEYLDAMRATLMMLGVALHTSQIYNPGLTWLISSDDESAFFYYLSHVIAAFRMPTFFFLSGFLSMLVLARRGPRAFMSLRIKRLVIPLLTTALTLNVLQAWLLNVTHWRSIGFADFFLRGEWLQHLWFLVDLLLYVSVLSLATTYGRSRASSRALRSLCERVPFVLLLAALPLLQVLFAAPGTLGLPVHRELIGTMTFLTLTQYLPFFAVGALAYSKEKFFDKFSSQPLPLLALGLALAVGIREFVPLLPSPAETAADTYLHFAINWLCICAFLRLFRMLVRRVTPTLRYLSDASYTVYLFHHIIVICLGLVFIDLSVSPALAYVLIVPLTLLTTFLLHSFVVGRYEAISLLFNGRRPRGSRGTTRAVDSNRPASALTP